MIFGRRRTFKVRRLVAGGWGLVILRGRKVARGLDGRPVEPCHYRYASEQDAARVGEAWCRGEFDWRTVEVLPVSDEIPPVLVPLATEALN